MKHRHIQDDSDNSIVAIEDILDRGTINDWRKLYKKIKTDPCGAMVGKIEVVIRNHYMYGTSRLWEVLIERCIKPEADLLHHYKEEHDGKTNRQEDCQKG